MINKLKELRETGSEEGFTLIELMIVVVIIGILAAIAIPIFMNQQRAAIVAGMKSDVKNTVTNIATALVKQPTAAVVIGSTADGGSVGPVGTTAASAASTTVAKFDVVTSDAATAVAVSGSWSAYTVTATNSSLAGAQVQYTSSDGETVTTGD